MSKALSAHEALIWVMVTTSASDHAMSDREVDLIARMVSNLPAFSGFAGSVAAVSEACVAHLAEENGLDDILDAVTAALPPALRETAFALAIEVAAIDGRARQNELAFLQMLEDRLDLSKLVAGAIELSARVRYRKVS